MLFNSLGTYPYRTMSRNVINVMRVSCTQEACLHATRHSTLYCTQFLTDALHTSKMDYGLLHSIMQLLGYHTSSMPLILPDSMKANLPYGRTITPSLTLQPAPCMNRSCFPVGPKPDRPLVMNSG